MGGSGSKWNRVDDGTVAALATSRGRGGIAVIQIFGRSASSILVELFKPARPSSDAGLSWDELGVGERSLHYGAVFDRGERIDEAIVRRVTARECEVCLHGGPIPVERLLRALRSRGVKILEKEQAVLARWVAGGRRTLLFETTRALEVARGLAALQRLAALSGSALEATVRSLTRFAIEARRSGTSPVRVKKGLSELLSSSGSFRRAIIPRRIAIVGPSNAGKSTLFNRLLTTDRVVVSDEAGTTRDAIEGWTEIDGFCVRLIDTAGIEIETAQDGASQLGQAQTRAAVASSDFVLIILDGSRTPEDRERRAIDVLCGAKECLFVLNKSDRQNHGDVHEWLARWGWGSPGYSVSASRGDGMEGLTRGLSGVLKGGGSRLTEDSVRGLGDPPRGTLFTNRQIALAREALGILASPEPQNRCVPKVVIILRRLLVGPPEFDDPVLSLFR